MPGSDVSEPPVNDEMLGKMPYGLLELAAMGWRVTQKSHVTKDARQKCRGWSSVGAPPHPGGELGVDPIWHNRYPHGRGNAGQIFGGLPVGAEYTVQWRRMRSLIPGGACGHRSVSADWVNRFRLILDQSLSVDSWSIDFG